MVYVVRRVTIIIISGRVIKATSHFWGDRLSAAIEDAAYVSAWELRKGLQSLLQRISDLACFCGFIAHCVSHIVHNAMPGVIDEAEGLLLTSIVLDDLRLQSIHYLFEFFESNVIIDLNLSQVGAQLFETFLGIDCIIIDIRNVLKTLPAR